jgi:hypothetical protein
MTLIVVDDYFRFFIIFSFSDKKSFLYLIFAAILIAHEKNKLFI